jgi:hypothetical protein
MRAKKAAVFSHAHTFKSIKSQRLAALIQAQKHEKKLRFVRRKRLNKRRANPAKVPQSKER